MNIMQSYIIQKNNPNIAYKKKIFHTEIVAMAPKLTMWKQFFVCYTVQAKS